MHGPCFDVGLKKKRATEEIPRVAGKFWKNHCFDNIITKISFFGMFIGIMLM